MLGHKNSAAILIGQHRGFISPDFQRHIYNLSLIHIFIMKKVAFHTLGCKVNTYESDAMEQQLRQRGYEIVPFEAGADVYVINTCSVTNMADRKSRQMLHRARKMNPEALIVAAGCYVQAVSPEALKEAGVDLAVGNEKKGSLADILDRCFADKRCV